MNKTNNPPPRKKKEKRKQKHETVEWIPTILMKRLRSKVARGRREGEAVSAARPGKVAKDSDF